MKSQEHLIIKQLLELEEKECNISTLSRSCKKDYKTTYNIIKRLEKTEIITLQKFGNSWRITFIPKIHPLLFETEYIRRAELLTNKNIDIMLKYFKDGLKTPFFILLLFGSYAKHTQTKHSDIDLFFIYPDNDLGFEKKIQNISSLIPLKLHINIFTEKEFLAMKKSKEITVGSEVIKHNIILHGIESYYELIQ